MNNVNKYCEFCGTKLEENANVCLSCGRQIKNTRSSKSKQSLPTWLIVIIVILAIGTILNINDENEEPVNHVTNKETNNNKSYKASDNTNNLPNQVPEDIEYIKISKDDLDEALENNAALARETYINKYVEVTGKLGTIDSELKYLSLVSSTDEWDLIGIHCTIKNKEQKEIVKTLTKDQEITVKGKITDVGEVLGYYLNITEISID